MEITKHNAYSHLILSRVLILKENEESVLIKLNKNNSWWVNKKDIYFINDHRFSLDIIHDYKYNIQYNFYSLKYKKFVWSKTIKTGNEIIEMLKNLYKNVPK